MKMSKETLQELKEFIEAHEDHILDYIDNDVEESLIIDEIIVESLSPEFEGKVYTEEEVSYMLSEATENIYRWYDDRCSECGGITECSSVEYNSVPYGDTFVNEQICNGTRCTKCGNEVEL